MAFKDDSSIGHLITFADPLTDRRRSSRELTGR
jgi:hypothetical protein